MCCGLRNTKLSCKTRHYLTEVWLGNFQPVNFSVKCACAVYVPCWVFLNWGELLAELLCKYYQFAFYFTFLSVHKNNLIRHSFGKEQYVITHLYAQRTNEKSGLPLNAVSCSIHHGRINLCLDMYSSTAAWPPESWRSELHKKVTCLWKKTSVGSDTHHLA